MKKYLPLLIIAVVIFGAIVGLKKIRNEQNVNPIAPLTTTIIPNNQEDSVNESPELTGTVSRGSAITLVVTSPQDNSTVTTGSLVVRGKTVPGAEVFVNDAETRADTGGNFSVTISLDEGENYILVVANDPQGNYSEKEITVIYETQ
ncbi:MAG: Ig-like domain-containing protein [Patescibacteria group bacterium]